MSNSFSDLRMQIIKRIHRSMSAKLMVLNGHFQEDMLIVLLASKSNWLKKKRMRQLILREEIIKGLLL